MKIILSFFLCFMASTLVFSYEKKLAICAVFKDDARFLSEWIDYHTLVGVEQFWLYNNNSSDNYKEVLKPYMKSGLVKLIHWPSPIHYDERWYASLSVQTSAYNHCLDKVRGRVEWLAMISVDEYIVPVKSSSIVRVLQKRYKRVSGLCINWVLFGTSGVEELGPSSLMTENMTRRAPFYFGNPMVYKTIVRPTHVKSCITPHSCLYKRHHWPVDTHKHHIDGEVTRNFYTDRLKIHHYWARDNKYLKEVKAPKYVNWGVYSGDVYNAAHLLNFQQDLEMLRFSHRLKRMRGISTSEIGPTLQFQNPEGCMEGFEVVEEIQPEDDVELGPFPVDPVVEQDAAEAAKDKSWWLFFFPEWFFVPYDENNRADSRFDFNVGREDQGGAELSDPIAGACAALDADVPVQIEHLALEPPSPVDAVEPLDGMSLSNLSELSDLDEYTLE